MAALVIVAVHLAVGATALLAATRRIGAAALGIIIIIIAAALHIAANRAQRQPRGIGRGTAIFGCLRPRWSDCAVADSFVW
jgi:hypothetical protein